jgi:hypothetical protein
MYIYYIYVYVVFVKIMGIQLNTIELSQARPWCRGWLAASLPPPPGRTGWLAASPTAGKQIGERRKGKRREGLRLVTLGIKGASNM